jgi:hypothetical protein
MATALIPERLQRTVKKLEGPGKVRIDRFHYNCSRHPYYFCTLFQILLLIAVGKGFGRKGVYYFRYGSTRPRRVTAAK